MKKQINKKALLISLILTVTCSFLIYKYLENNTVEQEPQQLFSIYVAARNIEIGEKINDTDIKTSYVTESDFNKYAVTNKDLIINKYAKEKIYTNEQFINERLTDDDLISLSDKIVKGERGFTIFVDESMLHALRLLEGDHIDVIASYDEKIIYPRLAITVIENSTVLAIGRENPILDDNGELITPITITLELTPKESEKLAHALNFGQINITLRGNGDDEIIDSEGTTIVDIAPSRFVNSNYINGDDVNE